MDIPKQVFEEPVYCDQICKIPLDRLMTSIQLDLNLESHLFKPFKVCESVPTPFLSDLRAEVTLPNGMYSKLNAHPRDIGIFCVDKKYIYQNEQGETIEEDPHVY